VEVTPVTGDDPETEWEELLNIQKFIQTTDGEIYVNIYVDIN
jgi:hypothetical protein